MQEQAVITITYWIRVKEEHNTQYPPKAHVTLNYPATTAGARAAAKALHELNNTPPPKTAQRGYARAYYDGAMVSTPLEHVRDPSDPIGFIKHYVNETRATPL